ncbi:PDR/VanB family oxidoreductase [Acinetobacter baumannii]|uniref:PDR/VanB family oxidoreductase n=1 Tax=Acinetobacter calcoaceticus/baumannii complex TaxID=909768 RepID=UPI0013B66B65|nr:PDR/VanB family oxidoreductase [Acinetobacter baumannii]NDX18466.1 oxidoreductase [Acinetobacter baumannii]NDX37868.1 oxidoreductase [Acinetobacter baumannii]
MDVIINKIHQLTPSIRAFELIATPGNSLPSFEAGSHIDVNLKNGLIRQYSLANCCDETHRYVIGVLNDENSRGGSRCLHQEYREGERLSISQPRNLFEIHPQTQKAILFAGGIGITPIISMAYRLKKQEIPFELHYFVRSREMIAFYGNLTEHFKNEVHFHIQNESETQCDVMATLEEPSSTRHLYVCGPNGFMEFIMRSANEANWSAEQLHQEHFVAQQFDTFQDELFTIEVLGSDRRIEVHPHQTATQALIENGFDIPISCEQGICGTCVTRVISGIPDHRDVFMTYEEHALNNQFTPCCSRAKSKTLVIALD